MEPEEDVQFGFKSDYDPKEARLRKDPITGAIYAAHGREPAPAKRHVKFADEYQDPYEEHSRRAIPFLRKEMEDFERVSSERFLSSEFADSAYAANVVDDGGEEIRLDLDIEGKEKKASADDGPFCYFSLPLQKLLRPHSYVLAITTILQPEISRLRRRVPLARTEDEIKTILARRGAVFLKKHEESSSRDGLVLVFQFSEIFEAEVVNQPRLEDEFKTLNERTVTSFIESRMYLRVILRKETVSEFFIEKFFFTLS